MARAVRVAPSTDPDIDIEVEPTPTAGKSKVLKMKAAPAAPATPAAKPKAEKKAKADKGPSKFVGRTSGMRVFEFQNQLMAKNFRAKLTDEQLAKAMREEFPAAVAFTTDHVRGIRSQWNNGKRGNPVPDKKLGEYAADGTVVVRTKTPPPAKKIKADAEAPKAKGVKVKKG